MDRKRDGPGPITLSRVFIQKCKNGTHPTHRHIKKLQVEMWNRLLGTTFVSRVCYIYTLTITRITYHFFPPIFITRVITFFLFFFPSLSSFYLSHLSWDDVRASFFCPKRANCWGNGMNDYATRTSSRPRRWRKLSRDSVHYTNTIVERHSMIDPLMHPKIMIWLKISNNFSNRIWL